ncbi:MAG: flagellar export chaperone FliS [Planctomycetota bacterium]|nr:flagellar export chaperone FliS [Planctomycetota bacterium]
MSSSQPNPYLHTKVMTASTAELRLLLFDGALKFAEQGKAALEAGNHEAAYEGISRCQDILIELINSLQPQHSPELCQQLSSLYTFMYTRLIAAIGERSPAIAEEVLGILRYERETWSMLLERLAEENAAAGGLTETPRAQPPQPAHASGSSLIGGSVSVKG